MPMSRKSLGSNAQTSVILFLEIMLILVLSKKLPIIFAFWIQINIDLRSQNLDLECFLKILLIIIFIVIQIGAAYSLDFFLIINSIKKKDLSLMMTADV